jgi:hypothetical protein
MGLKIKRTIGEGGIHTTRSGGRRTITTPEQRAERMAAAQAKKIEKVLPNIVEAPIDALDEIITPEIDVLPEDLEPVPDEDDFELPIIIDDTAEIDEEDGIPIIVEDSYVKPAVAKPGEQDRFIVEHLTPAEIDAFTNTENEDTAHEEMLALAKKRQSEATTVSPSLELSETRENGDTEPGGYAVVETTASRKVQTTPFGIPTVAVTTDRHVRSTVPTPDQNPRTNTLPMRAFQTDTTPAQPHTPTTEKTTTSTQTEQDARMAAEDRGRARQTTQPIPTSDITRPIPRPHSETPILAAAVPAHENTPPMSAAQLEKKQRNARKGAENIFIREHLTDREIIDTVAENLGKKEGAHNIMLHRAQDLFIAKYLTPHEIKEMTAVLGGDDTSHAFLLKQAERRERKIKNGETYERQTSPDPNSIEIVSSSGVTKKEHQNTPTTPPNTTEARRLLDSIRSGRYDTFKPYTQPPKETQARELVQQIQREHKEDALISAAIKAPEEPKSIGYRHTGGNVYIDKTLLEPPQHDAGSGIDKDEWFARGERESAERANGNSEPTKLHETFSHISTLQKPPTRLGGRIQIAPETKRASISDNLKKAGKWLLAGLALAGTAVLVVLVGREKHETQSEPEITQTTTETTPITPEAIETAVDVARNALHLAMDKDTSSSDEVLLNMRTSLVQQLGEGVATRIINPIQSAVTEFTQAIADDQWGDVVREGQEITNTIRHIPTTTPVERAQQLIRQNQAERRASGDTTTVHDITENIVRQASPTGSVAPSVSGVDQVRLSDASPIITRDSLSAATPVSRIQIDIPRPDLTRYTPVSERTTAQPIPVPNPLERMRNSTTPSQPSPEQTRTSPEILPPTQTDIERVFNEINAGPLNRQEPDMLRRTEDPTQSSDEDEEIIELDEDGLEEMQPLPEPAPAVLPSTPSQEQSLRTPGGAQIEYLNARLGLTLEKIKDQYPDGITKLSPSQIRDLRTGLRANSPTLIDWVRTNRLFESMLRGE